MTITMRSLDELKAKIEAYTADENALTEAYNKIKVTQHGRRYYFRIPDIGRGEIYTMRNLAGRESSYVGAFDLLD